MFCRLELNEKDEEFSRKVNERAIDQLLGYLTIIIQQTVTLSKYLSSVGNRYPAVYVASYVGRKSEVKKCRQKVFKKMLRALLSIC